ncbi:hypothetical protein B0X52_08320, partial [Helicobacter pylori]
VQCFLVFFSVFLSFWHGLFLLVVGWAFFNAPLFLSVASFDLFQKSVFKSFNCIFAHQFSDVITRDQKV